MNPFHFRSEEENLEMDRGLNAKCSVCGHPPGFMCRAHFVEEIERLRIALRRIARQGTQVGVDGHPWRHWSTIAADALATTSPRNPDE